MLAIIASNTYLYSQEYDLSGTISDVNGDPLEGVTVYLFESKQSSISDANGYFIISDVNPGEYHFHAVLLGYKTVGKDVSVSTGHVNLSFAMETSSKKLKPIVIEAESEHHSLETPPIHVDILEREQLERSMSMGLSNALKEFQGVDAISTGMNISKPVIRGMSGNRLAVIESGIKQEGQQWGTDHGLEIDQYHLDEIAIIKGASSLSYGSDGTSGIVLIKQPTIPPSGHTEVRARAIYGSVNESYGAMASVKGNLNRLSYRVALTSVFAGDYKIPADSFNYANWILPVVDQTLTNTASRELNGRINLGWHHRNGNTALTLSSFNQTNGFFPGAFGAPNPFAVVPDGDTRNVSTPYQEVNHQKVSINHDHHLEHHWLKVDLGYQLNTRKEIEGTSFNEADNVEQLALQLELHTITSNIRLEQIDDHKKWKYTAGIQTSYMDNQIAGREFLIPDYSSINSGIYFIERLKLTDITTISGGVRADFAYVTTQEHYREARFLGESFGSVQRSTGFDRDFFNYAASLGIDQTLNEHMDIRLNGARTFRVPNIAELASNGPHHGSFRYERGNADLTTEKGYQSDIEWIFENEKWHTSITGFYNYFDNYIYIKPTGQFPTYDIPDTIVPFPEPGQIYEYVEAEVIHRGGELDVEYQLLDEWAVNVAGSYVELKQFDFDIHLPLVPPLKWNVGLKWEKSMNGWLNFLYAGIQLEAAADQNNVDQNEDVTVGYEILHFNTGLKFGRQSQWSVDMSIRNLMDTEYFNHLSQYRQIGLPEPGRNVMVQLRYFIDVKTKDEHQ